MPRPDPEDDGPVSIEAEEWSRPYGPPLPTEVRRDAQALVASCVAAKARGISRVVTEIFDAGLAVHEVKVTQLLILAALAERGGTCLRDLCVQLGTLESTTSRALAIMVRNGWVERDLAPRPRWYWFVLTRHGARILASALPAWRTAQLAAVRFVERELDALTRAARRSVKVRVRRTLVGRDSSSRWRARERHRRRNLGRKRRHAAPRADPTGAWPAPRSPP